MDLEVSRPSAIDAFQWLREVCSSKLLQTPIQLGGPGSIDESLFRHKPKGIGSLVNFIGPRYYTLSITEEEQLHRSSGFLVW